ncbi:MAG: TIGR01777 family protein [Flavobacteriaceae bacterium]|nr:TIGR01777 family protein [Flavobacteriaceae bacterium]
MIVLITGATGLIGTEITRQAKAKGHTVHYLTTSRDKMVSESNYKGFYWNTQTGEVDTNCLQGATKIINLAGASISERWTENHKRAILDSRINSIQTLYTLLSENEHTIDQFCSASALGIYPSSLTNKYSEEETEINAGFLGKVVQTWENEADLIAKLGIDLAKIRIGIVLANKGGALQEMAKPIKKGIGAAIGSGKQWQSWIHINDLARLFLYVIEHKITGIFNAVASNPVTNQELTKALAQSLDKSIFLPNVPKFAIKLVLGEMAAITLESQYLLNDKIKSKGFDFKFDQLDHALGDLF